MDDLKVFYPPRMPGIIFHGILVLALMGGSIYFIYRAFNQQSGWALILFLLGALLLIALLPIAAYRGIALLRGSYIVERDGLRVRWGLRSEDIPLTEITWVRPASDLEIPLRLPIFSMPGAILGSSIHKEIGPVEFIASNVTNMVVVASINKTLILSPEDPDEFVHKFQRVIEMGSLYPIQPFSSIPAAFVREIFKDRYARALILAISGLTLLLLIATSLLIPLRPTVSLGYDINAIPLSPVRSNRLLLLPVISVFFTILNLLAGSYFFRHEETRQISFFIWAAGVLTPLLMMVSVVVLLFTTA